MNKDAEKLRDLLKPYFMANSMMNAQVAADLLKERQKLLAKGIIPPVNPVPFVSPSFQDLQYWVYESGPYKPEEVGNE